MDGDPFVTGGRDGRDGASAGVFSGSTLGASGITTSPSALSSSFPAAARVSSFSGLVVADTSATAGVAALGAVEAGDEIASWSRPPSTGFAEGAALVGTGAGSGADGTAGFGEEGAF